MSATFNVERFAEYFSSPVMNRLDPAPVINLDALTDKKAMYTISEYYLCQLGILGPVSRHTNIMHIFLKCSVLLKV